MKVDGGLSIVVGPMGAGKTLFEVRSGVRHMLHTGWWVTNVQLYDDALERIAHHVAPTSRRNRRKILDKLEDRYRYTDDLQHALSHAVDRRMRKPGVALARLGWDESLSDLNAREWDGGRGKSKDDRAELFERVPMLRKNGVAGYLLVQHEELIDKNARRICNWVIRLQNQRENTRIMGVRVKVLPPLFLAFWYQANSGDKRASVARAVATERYTLTWHRKLYDTLGLFGVSARDDDEGATVWLGRGLPALPVAARHEPARLPVAADVTT
ncbi:MAG TPA: hypothetical protein VIL92_06515 [Gaiellaceae bacterium]